MEAPTSVALSRHSNIIGIKEASGNLNQCMEIIKNAEDDFLMISGEDSLTLPMTSIGGAGAISVIANLRPKEFSEMTRLGLAGNYKEANKLHYQLLRGYELVGREGNPVSVKTGLEALGLIERHVRPPLYRGTEDLLSDFKDYMTSKF